MATPPLPSSSGALEYQVQMPYNGAPMGPAGPPAPPSLNAPNIAPQAQPAPFNFATATPGAFTGTAPTPTPFGSYDTPAPFTGTAPTATPFGSFTGTAPTATPFGSFTAPDPTALSKYGQFRLDEGLKARERSAAARGTLLTGALQGRLNEFAQGVASEEADKDYRRAADTYTLNRGTNAQNFGQEMGRFNADLAGYGANAATNAENFNQQRGAYQDALAGYGTNADVSLAGYAANRGTNAQNYGQQQDAYQNALAGYNTNASTALAASGQGLNAATAAYDRNYDASRTAYTDAAADTLRRSGVDAANNASTYQAQMDAYARQQADLQAATAAKLASKPKRPSDGLSGWAINQYKQPTQNGIIG